MEMWAYMGETCRGLPVLVFGNTANRLMMLWAVRNG